ncbi:hypothetical protein BRX36_17090, partial [Sphingomonas sp. S-NIH.Pt1_0416]
MGPACRRETALPQPAGDLRPGKQDDVGQRGKQVGIAAMRAVARIGTVLGTGAMLAACGGSGAGVQSTPTPPAAATQN